ncbi:site-specific integrase [Stenotrophomonas sp.]|uniref:site-specific integrase n=1 Tax=Stenotrophomonas sp. TaxID=69392 RepID=UPI0028AEEE98|nr:site-specific integrase [Stenotrophomonas sp.]
MATKRKRGNSWHYIVRRAGLLPKPIYLSFEAEKEGDEYVARLEALLDRGVVPEEFVAPKADPKRLRGRVSEYRSKQAISVDDAKLLPVVLSRLPIEIAMADLTFYWATEWVASMKRVHNLSPSTIRHHVGALSRALDWLAAQGDLPTNPLRLLPRGYSAYTADDAAAVALVEGRKKEDQERDRRLEDGEEERIREILAGEKPSGRQRALELNHQPALQLLFDMALETGMRMREMYTLTMPQIDLPKRTIFLDKTKNGSKRQVPISSVLLGLLKAYEGDEDGRLFPWWDGDLSKPALAKVTSRLSRQYDRIFQAANCEHLNFHDLRHEATSRLFERTSLSDLEIAKITGHKDARMLARYANLRASNLAERLW